MAILKTQDERHSALTRISSSSSFELLEDLQKSRLGPHVPKLPPPPSTPHLFRPDVLQVPAPTLRLLSDHDADETDRDGSATRSALPCDKSSSSAMQVVAVDRLLLLVCTRDGECSLVGILVLFRRCRGRAREEASPTCSPSSSPSRPPSSSHRRAMPKTPPRAPRTSTPSGPA